MENPTEKHMENYVETAIYIYIYIGLCRGYGPLTPVDACSIRTISVSIPYKELVS